mmetsp:Transcript_28437/g.51674  ORF Transcript_28437/g.51674 Transcript_28437/m.51674 type:complete len:215 (+) Transcript_28437:46-690(+)
MARRDPDCANLVNVQLSELPKILGELEREGQKRSHWAWWVFPTEMPGRNDPYDTFVTKAFAQELLVSEASDGWRQVLEKICDLAETGKGKGVLPKRLDQERVEYFLDFWKSVSPCPAWMSSVLRRLSNIWEPGRSKDFCTEQGLAGKALVTTNSVGPHTTASKQQAVGIPATTRRVVAVVGATASRALPVASLRAYMPVKNAKSVYIAASRRTM